MTKGMKAILLALLCPFNSSVVVGAVFAEQVGLPERLKSAMVTDTVFNEAQVRPLKGGTFRWPSGYVSAVSLGSSKNCSIYVYYGGVLKEIFSSYPCAFIGRPKLVFDRDPIIPDILYKVDIFAPQNGVMVDILVAFYYDKDRDVYCESQSLASWYHIGNKNIPPKIYNARCPFDE